MSHGTSHARPLGVTISPVFLRLALAVIFMYTGLAKYLNEITVTATDAAILANMEVDSVRDQAIGAADEADASPVIFLQADAAADTVGEVAGDAGAEAEAAAEAAGVEAGPTDAAPSGAASGSGIVYTAADFGDDVTVPAVNGIALMLHYGANPGVDDAGEPKMAIVPQFAVENGAAVLLANTAAITEIVLAVLVFVGFLARFGGLCVAGVMAVAMWLTQIGPAMQAGDAILYFLPNYDRWDIGAWTPLMFQLVLLCAGLSLLFAGDGTLSLASMAGGRSDRRSTKSQDEDEYEEEEEYEDED